MVRGPGTSASASTSTCWRRGQTPEDAIRAEQQAEAATQVSIANTITSLRLCATHDWSRYVERVSLVEQILQRDPAGVYGRMDFASRDRYRQAVEEVADSTGEAQVRGGAPRGRSARAPPTSSDPRTPRATSASISSARGGVPWKHDVGYRPRLRERAATQRFSPRHGGLPGRRSPSSPWPWWRAAVAAARAARRLSAPSGRDSAPGSLLPASELATGSVQRLVAALARHAALPRLDPEGGVPEHAETMVVIPTILDSLEGVRELARAPRSAGPRQPRSAHPLRASSATSGLPTAGQPEDDAILDAAVAAIEELNDRRHGRRIASTCSTGSGAGTRAKAAGWAGSASAARSRSSFTCCGAPTRHQLRGPDAAISPCCRGSDTCITLDRDTRLPRDAARTLVGIAVHPLQPARYDPRQRRVTEGYGILQPRVSVTFESAAGSLFARLYAGHTGVDPYTTAVSDTYQDLFGEGIFTGKGLIDVDAFAAALRGRVPENALLSHDLFEGLHARTGLVTDVEVVDDYPASVLAHARRLHRWVRGDWQILGWLFPWVRTRRGSSATACR